YVDPQMGYLPTPMVTAQVQKIVDGKTLYNVTYSFGSWGERITPHENQSSDKHLTLFGGSLAFGEGVNDNETILHHLIKKGPPVSPYNFAFRGHGPYSFLARLEFTNLLVEMTPNRGTFLYLHAPFHFRRVYGYSNIIGVWAQNTPQYEISDSGQLEYRGLFAQTQPLLTKFYSLFAQLGLVRRLGLYFPLFADDRARNLTCSVLGKINELILRHQPESRLLVVTLPREAGSQLPKCLQDGTFIHHDLRHTFPTHDLKRMEIPGDGHYNPLGNQILGDTIRPLIREIQ
ncbi:MAG: hypothetical protein KDD43_13315, partial [Bdellovibrionales bacterium]|nr:hypothetical protein [Bdellovibrionales bacterium]